MEDKIYNLESNVMSYNLGFEGQNVYCELIRRLKECPLNQVTKVSIKKTPMGAGDEISFRIFFVENGKEKKFPWIQAKVTNPVTAEFLDDLQSRIPQTATWEDKRNSSATVDESGRNVYDLQYLPFGYAGAGLGRGLQIWIYLICLAVLVIPLIYYIYLLATGGYRIYTNDQGITIKKTGSTYFSWDELENVDFTRINVIDRQNYSQTEVLKAVFKGKGKKASVVMRYDHALPLLKELAAQDIISEEYLSQFS
ncbi:hypothetical protein K6119_16075 [Paracrocinitomix mangrovi]|uniref:hypothetical protein n=1 Tax=Paracrocinitomix mangrovi TaxID=2862509 RepID=UPI001C8E050A|nr:hypothetical protein [Paracrocinitomix mangrovi]UKN01246.1 hypothetical protein K6119_16075 [Paracrocinitomix mangrovi]